MSKRLDSRILILLSEIDKTEEAISKVNEFYLKVKSDMPDDINDRDQCHAVLLSEVFVNYYTCVESMFFRISQFFENGLAKERWHADLLEKMRLNIRGIRNAVISDKTYTELNELLKFRHFKRYYYDYNYDWDRLDLLENKYKHLAIHLPKEFTDFKMFLEEIENSDG